MSKPNRAVMDVVDILAHEFRYEGLTSTYLGDLAQKIVDTVLSGAESHPEWDACREQTEEELAGLTDAWFRAQGREYLALREAVLERNYS